MPFKICLAGCGAISEAQHGPSILKYVQLHDDTVFAACCDIIEEKARIYHNKFNTSRYYTNLSEMLDTEKPDAVCLICPENKTAELSCFIMEKGYPLLLEKPPGLNADETRRMISVAHNNNALNQVAFNRRFVPLVQKMIEKINNFGGCKEITDLHYRMLRVDRRDINFATTAIHGIDLVRYIAGADYKQIKFTYKELSQYGDSVANIHLNGLMSSGIVVHMDFLPMSGVVTERLEVNTTNGIFFVELPVWKEGLDMPGRITHYINNECVFTTTGEEIAGCTEEYMLNGFYHENKSFFDNIRNKRIPADDIASDLQGVEISDCIYNREALYEHY